MVLPGSGCRFWTTWSVPTRWRPVVSATIASILLLLVFLCNMSYMYGSLFGAESRIHNFHILAVDYDGGDVGEAMRVSYQHLQADTFPTVNFESRHAYPNIQAIRHAVCHEGYWGAVYTHEGATDRLLNALAGEAASYNASDAVTYEYIGVYYPIIGPAYIDSSMQTLAAVSSRTLLRISGPSLVRSANFSNAIALSALNNPIAASSVVYYPTYQGARVLLNTVTIVVGNLMQFFFVMALNQILGGTAHATGNMSKRKVYVARLALSKMHTLLSGLITASYVYAFRENWDLTVVQFCETWMCYWLYMEVTYLIMDTIVVAVVPLRFASFFVITWVILSITSTIYPFELNPGFYHWAWALPAHNVWRLILEVWSQGCKSQKAVAIPVLLVWWIVGSLTSAWSLRRKCIIAKKDAQSTTKRPEKMGKPQMLTDKPITEA